MSPHEVWQMSPRDWWWCLQARQPELFGGRPKAGAVDYEALHALLEE
jgi:hypothetical protein